MTTDLILGTAGHIDHGKTSLIRALTGVDTDRLPEEKKRGITIDLGFAELLLEDYRLGIVDVPGHEKFVRNMLAGATGMDIALLVVAADDSVKQQTREHLDILRLLRLQVGVIALTKCDMAEPDWTELVEEEIRTLVADTFLADAPIVQTSVMSGLGIDELRAELKTAADQAAALPLAQRIEAPFRMAIDRTFTLAGHGTVVTGSVSSGRCAAGDELLLEPGQNPVRIRSVQNHDRAAEEVHRGQRAAINLAGVKHDEIERGQELASPGLLVPSKLMTVRFYLLPESRRPLKNRTRARFHLGTAEVMASVILLDVDQLEPGTWAYAQVYLSENLVATWGQPFVLRSESPVTTIGGGQVLDPTSPKLTRHDSRALEQLKSLASENPLERAAAAFYFSGLRGWSQRDLSRAVAVDDFDAALEHLRKSGSLCELRLSPTRTLRVHRLALDEIFERVEKSLAKLHEQFPLEPVMDRSRLAARFQYLGEDALVQALLLEMAKDRRVRLTDRGIALAGHGPQLSKNEQRLLGEIIEKFLQAGVQPPTVAEIQAATTRNQASVPQLVVLAAAQGDLVQVSDEFYLHVECEQRVREQLTEKLTAGEGLTMSQIRELLETSRKYAVPLCEYFDRVGFTKRNGDLRVLAKD